ncbi:MAG TPA: helix-turn-helix domain-containing protein [Steroidobacteraceae bacterium]|nr:helix-turn-helix domain-containing protein [Steroidobacteraceae bacterium]
MPVLPTLEPQTPPGYLDLEHAGALAQADRETVRRWIRMGKLSGVRLGNGANGKILVARDALDRFLREVGR